MKENEESGVAWRLIICSITVDIQKGKTIYDANKERKSPKYMDSYMAISNFGHIHIAEWSTDSSS